MSKEEFEYVHLIHLFSALLFFREKPIIRTEG